MVVTTISCDAAILRCAECQREVATAAVSDLRCHVCGGAMPLGRRCDAAFSLRRDAVLIRCIAENKDGWRCEHAVGRDFCPDHVHLSSRIHSAGPDLHPVVR